VYISHYQAEREEISGGWRKLHDEDLCLSLNNVKMAKLGQMKCKKHVACMAKIRNACI
jgi:hypothetical protein